MNGKDKAMQGIELFFKSEELGILITGTHQVEKHILAMAMIQKCYKNAYVLFRINGLQNITSNSFLGCVGAKKQPKAGEQVRIGQNYYKADSLVNRGTWLKTSDQALARERNIEPVEDICRNKTFTKYFFAHGLTVTTMSIHF